METGIKRKRLLRPCDPLTPKDPDHGVSLQKVPPQDHYAPMDEATIYRSILILLTPIFYHPQTQFFTSLYPVFDFRPFELHNPGPIKLSNTFRKVITLELLELLDFGVIEVLKDERESGSL